MALQLITPQHPLLLSRRMAARLRGNDLVTQATFSLHCTCGFAGEDPLPAAFPDLAPMGLSELEAFLASQCTGDVRRRCPECGKAAAVDAARCFLWSQHAAGDVLLEIVNGVAGWRVSTGTPPLEPVAREHKAVRAALADQLLRAASFMATLPGGDRHPELVESAVGLLPDSPLPILARARFALLAGDLAAALEDLRAAASKADGSAAACRQLGAMLAEIATRHQDGELLNRALDWLDQALSLDPGHPGTALILGRLFVASGNFAEALEHLALAAGERELALDANHLRGVALLQLGRVEESLQVFEALAEIHKDDPDVLRMRAWTRHKTGDTKAARAELQRLASAHPDDEETGYFLALMDEPDDGAKR
jgi:tetratricopeptide (TPR) repeat protein